MSPTGNEEELRDKSLGQECGPEDKMSSDACELRAKHPRELEGERSPQPHS